jgi:hypothetical protein
MGEVGRRGGYRMVQDWGRGDTVFGDDGIVRRVAVRERAAVFNEEVIFGEELEEFGLGGEEDTFEGGIGQDPFCELPHSRVHPSIVQHEDCSNC